MKGGPNRDAVWAERKPGHCAMCDQPLPPKKPRGRSRLICEREDCRRGLMAAYSQDRHYRAAKKQARLERDDALAQPSSFAGR